MLAPGTVLQQRYEIIAKIGQGGMGAIYEATDRRLGHHVAIKQTLVNDAQFARAFEREARLLASLRHPALPKVSDHWQDDQGQFLVMEYIPGDDLAALVQKRSQLLPVDVVLRWSDQLLNALHYLHSQQPPIIHRDIKPHNIKITPQDEPILLDFGLAKGMVSTTVQTTASVYAYTLQYAPLEQIHGQPTDQRSDLYSFAATIYFLLAGTPPPSAVTRAAAMATGQTDPLRPLNQVRDDIPAHIDSALRQALSLSIDQRPASATALRQALVEPAAPTVIDVASTSDLPPRGKSRATIPPSTVRPTQAPNRRFPMLALGVVALLVALGSLGGFLLMQSRTPIQAPSSTQIAASIESPVANTAQTAATAEQIANGAADATQQPSTQTAIPTEAATSVAIESAQPVATEAAAAELSTSAATELPTPQTEAAIFAVGQTAYVQMIAELPLWTDARGGDKVFERPLLTRGAMLAVLALQDDAVQVRTVDGVDGWLHGAPTDVLSAEPPIYAEQDNYASGTQVRFIWPNGIPLRNAPSSEAEKVVARVANETAATVTQQLGDWIEVTLENGTSGWARWFYNGTRYVVPEPPPFNRILDEATPAMSGDDVLLVQRQLLVLSYNQPDNLDGIYGPRTIEQVRAFQQRNELDVDGVVGANTWQRLFSGSAIANQS